MDTIWCNAVQKLLDHGHKVPSRVGSTLELIGQRFVITDFERTFLLNPIRRLSPEYASAELLWYLSGDRNIERILPYAKQYENFAEKDGVAFGAYGARWINDPGFKAAGGGHQFITLLEILEAIPHSRQAIITMWNGGDLVHAGLGDKRDLPCTLSWQFFVRNGRLTMVCTMRSEDAWLGFPYDIYVNTTIMRLLADELHLEMGVYIHNVGSFHLYEKNKVKAKAAVAQQMQSDTIHDWALPPGDLFEAIGVANKLEEAIRTGQTLEPPSNLGDVLSDAVICTSRKWRSSFTPQSARLKEALENYR